MKVKIFNKKLRDSFFLKISLFSAFATLLLAFVPIPSKIQGLLGGVFLVFLVIIYIYDWRKANKLNSVEITTMKIINFNKFPLMKAPSFAKGEKHCFVRGEDSKN